MTGKKKNGTSKRAGGEKRSKRITARDFKMMWGEKGPYSQVRLCEETRIIDDKVSRVFLVVEAAINPFTFEFVRERRAEFAGDEAVLQLLNHADYRGPEFGYIISAGEIQKTDDGAMEFARKQADMATAVVIRMHEFVMRELGLGEYTDEMFGEVGDAKGEGHFVWNDSAGAVERMEDGVWSAGGKVGVPAGVKHNKGRFFVVLAFTEAFDFKKEKVMGFGRALTAVAESLGVEVEDIESFREYMLVTALLPFDLAPADFVDSLIEVCGRGVTKGMFEKDCFVTNVSRPKQDDIIYFLNNIPRG